ncbi:TonB-dependent receptor [Novosphingobium sp. FSY-8]|uniref:TonB-dependent receptor n=1 Tax=Novosphingobium ovatum TaxID=1908523 RepID=A0ABW9XI46_9SPHN|nr:TonB-dependent receptor [Novosphingobium ovatum]NBC38156.1 TonB-dependent receptor [Novosphingobium ovatum]
MHINAFRRWLWAGAALCAATAPFAHAATAPATAPAAADDQSTSAGQTGQANDSQSLTTADIVVIGSAAAQSAPLVASLTTTQPQAVISRSFIDNANAGADFNELIALTPGVSISGTGNGQGFSETKAVIRGFQDGEYNVTYDSIPFADTNNPTHHSTAFFPSNTIETVVVDRGPGNASQLGQATYGGNLNMYSRAVAEQFGGQLQMLYGSWNSLMGRFEIQSGRIEHLGGARMVFAGQYLKSQGALSFSPVQSKNLFFKMVLPIGANHTLTAMSTWNRNYYYQSDSLKGSTCGSALKGVSGFSNAALDANGNLLTQLTANNCAAGTNGAVYGRDYGLGGDATKQDYWAYNRTDKTTDFSYLRLQSVLGSGLSLDNRLYMYGYSNNTMSGNSGTVVTGFNTATLPYTKLTNSNILGYNKLNKYRVLGYIGQLTYDFWLGKIRAGGWYEHSNTWRHTWDLDRTTGLPSYNENAYLGTAATAAYPGISLANIKYEQNSGWNQFQLFGEFEFRPFDSLSITPGVKYVHFTRSVNALVNQTTRAPADMQATWTKTLPFLTVNWQASRNWSFYGQYAQGMYVPDLSSFYSTSATLAQSLADLQPMTTTNYQIGTVWHGRRVSLDLDGYIINVNNKLGTCTTVGCDTSLTINIGQVRYKGVEGQVAVMPLDGLSLFVNGSYNYAQSVTTGAQIAKAPFTTAAIGFVYARHGLRVSYNQKYTGVQFANEYNGNPNYRLYRLSPYSVGEFAISQEFGKNFRLGLTVSNVFDNRAITSISTSSSGAPTVTVGGVTYQNGYGQGDQFSFLPPRQFMVDARFTF